VAGDPTGELEIQFAILELMKDRRAWSNAELKARLGRILPLTPEDRSVGVRTNEALWENRVNNALSPSRSSSLYAKGHVENCGHGLHRISENGLKFINDDWSLDDLLRSI
jgi:hypothetical protein